MSEYDDKLRLDIKRWMMAEGWAVTEREHDQAHWILVGEDRGKRRVSLAQPRSPAEQIRILAKVELSAAHRQQFAALPAQVRDAILWDIRMRLLAMHVEFTGINEPLQQVQLSQRIYLDALTRDALMQRVSQVKDAMLCVIWLAVRHLEGKVTAPTTAGDAMLH
jgi:hypothetical protein